MKTDIIVIGAGIAGLSAARTLARKGKSVLIIEARNRAGGRIHTLHGEGMSRPVESGAEFVHGAAPRVNRLAREAGVKLIKTESNAWVIINGRPHRSEIGDSDMESLNKKLENLKGDMSMSEFLDVNFKGAKFDALRSNIKSRLEGFDLADVAKISARSIKEEWSDEEEFTGSRPNGGYSRLIDFLVEENDKAGVRFLFSTPIAEIRWNAHSVTVITTTGNHYDAKQTLITIPAAVLRQGTVRFSPALPEHEKAFQKIETGNVVKYLVEFKDRAWERKKSGLRRMENLGFLFSDAPVPTWWTQLPTSSPLLMGWLGGPASVDLSNEVKLTTKGIESLAYIFACSEDIIWSNIHSFKVYQWLSDPYSRGAYSYKTLETPEYLKIINTPVKDTIFFAGEAFNAGKESGTVEAALESAEHTIRTMR